MSEWNYTGTPDVPKGHARTFIVAVRRPDGNVYVFPACYLNALPVEHDDNDRMVETEDDPFDFATGWHSERDHSYGETAYFPMLDEGSGDQLVGWQPLPKWTEESSAWPVCELCRTAHAPGECPATKPHRAGGESKPCDHNCPWDSDAYGPPTCSRCGADMPPPRALPSETKP